MSPDIKCSDLERELISGFFVLTTDTPIEYGVLTGFFMKKRTQI
jgi:hypothetical protein